MTNPINAREKHSQRKMAKALIEEHKSKRKSEIIGQVVIGLSFLAIGIVFTLMVI